MNELPRPGRMCRLLYLFVIVFAVITTTTAAVRWFLIDNPNLLRSAAAFPIQSRTLTPEFRLAGFVLEMIRLEAALYALLALYRICEAYPRGEIFGRITGALYRKFGAGLILLAAANGMYTMILGAVFSFLSGTELLVRLDLNTADLYLFGVGVAVLMLSLVIDEAYRIHGENATSV
ncbi:MAG: hypothetical protein AB9866_15390 [Syntrophobacteraceae bacterium]